MREYYITFGQIHTHSINGKTLDKDTVAVIKAENKEQAREIAFKFLGRTWCFVYEEIPDMSYFPRGLININ